MAEDLVFYATVNHDASGVKIAKDPNTAQVAEAGAWTRISYSLRAYGIVEEFKYNPQYSYGGTGGDTSLPIDSFSVSCLYGVTESDYFFYWDGFDVCDYNEQDFPALDTSTEDEKIAAFGGDRDQYLQKYIVSLGDDAHKNYSCNLAYENVKYEGQTVISKPEGLDSTSFVKYGVTLKSTSFGRQFGMPIQFAGEIDSRYIDTENIDWSTAYIGFWVNTDFSNQPEGTTLGFFLLNDAIKTSGTNATTLPAEVDYVTSGEWTYVELSLANYASLIISGESYTLDVCWVYNSKVEKTDFNETIYIDGVSVYNKQIDTISALANYCVEKGTDIYKYAYGQASVSVKNYDSSMEKPEEGWTKETYLQYDVTALSGSTNIYTLPINIVSGGKYALSSETKTDVNVTDWTTAYVGLWVYNDSDVDLTIHALKSDSSTAFNATALATIKKGSWTYVEIALSSFNITENVFDTNSYNFKLYAAYKSTGYNSTTETDENYYGNFSARYCIGSFEIYNK